MVGKFGVGKRDTAGSRLLAFLLTNSLVLTNTQFAKPLRRRVTWLNPASKRMHCIDYIAIRSKDRQICVDAEVDWKANCFTDHSMVRATLRFEGGARTERKVQSRREPPLAIEKLKDPAVRAAYSEIVRQRWSNLGQDGRSIDGLRDIMMTSGDEVLGKRKRRGNDDWYQEAKEQLDPLVHQKQACYEVYALDKTDDAKRNLLRRAESAVRREVVAAKERWVLKKSAEVDTVHRGSSSAWQAAKSIRVALEGAKAVQEKPMRNAQGQVCMHKGG